MASFHPGEIFVQLSYIFCRKFTNYSSLELNGSLSHFSIFLIWKTISCQNENLFNIHLLALIVLFSFNFILKMHILFLSLSGVIPKKTLYRCQPRSLQDGTCETMVFCLLSHPKFLSFPISLFCNSGMKNLKVFCH